MTRSQHIVKGIWETFAIVGIAVLCLLIGTTFFSQEADSDTNAEAAPHSQLSRSEQVRIMQECYEDAGKIHRYVNRSIENRLVVTQLFFIYRTGMAINNNLVQPELSQWNDE